MKEVNDFYGLCPECGKEGDMKHIGRGEYFYCEKHKKVWNPCARMFDRHEGEPTNEETRAFFADYELVATVGNGVAYDAPGGGIQMSEVKTITIQKAGQAVSLGYNEALTYKEIQALQQFAEEMANETEKTGEVDQDLLLYYGGCPVCGDATAMSHIDSAEWFYCEKHKTCWNPSDNCISHHPDETPEERHQEAIATIKFFVEGGYTVVEPVYVRGEEATAKLNAAKAERMANSPF